MTDHALETRARRSGGASDAAIHALASHALAERNARGVIVDVGCGSGRLRDVIGDRASRYIGIDAVRYGDLPAGVEFHRADLDADPIPLPGASADAVVALETIEHLENPRRFVRELARVVRPGGVVIVSTPNQLSLLSLLTLVLKRRFNAFQEASYPAHRTALLEVDLRRIAAECGLERIEVRYTGRGRVALTPWHYPPRIALRFPQALSDNVLLIAERPTR